MGIRRARINDGQVIKRLLDQLDYQQNTAFIEDKMKLFIESNDAELLVYEKDGAAQAFISIHYIPQIAIEGDFARISYFAVDSTFRSHGIGKEILDYSIRLAQQRGCDRVEVHSHSRRTGAHKFYQREGFVESPKYFIKMLTEGED